MKIDESSLPYSYMYSSHSGFILVIVKILYVYDIYKMANVNLESIQYSLKVYSIVAGHLLSYRKTLETYGSVSYL